MFHIQAQNHSQHVAPLNEELLRKQSQDSVNGECWSGKKKYWRETVMQREVNRFKGMEPESAAPGRIFGTCLAQHFSPS